MIITAFTLALSLGAAAAERPAQTEVVFELAAELGTAEVNEQSPGTAVGLHVAGFLAVKGPVSLGLALNGYALPFASGPTYPCPAGPCAGVDGFNEVRGGPAVRVTQEFGRLAAVAQVSPQYELQLEQYSVLGSQMARWDVSAHFAVELEVGGDIWLWRQIAIGPRFCVSVGKDALSWGVGVAFSARAP